MKKEKQRVDKLKEAVEIGTAPNIHANERAHARIGSNVLDTCKV